MSTKQTDLNPSIARLQKDGFEVEIQHQHLLVHSIPYINQYGELKKATLSCPYNGLGSQDTTPQDHTMWFTGEMPHDASGHPMNQVVNHSNKKLLFPGFTGDHYLSNKPNGQAFINFYDKVTHYHTLFVSAARVLDPNSDGRTGVVHLQRDTDSVFVYPDTASSRVGITAISEVLAQSKIAIIGLGGTGSYILDLISKTPVKEIHLFDQDDIESHNAFRSPGAIPREELNKNNKKVSYLKRLYSEMHTRIFEHPYFIKNENLDSLDKFSFVFIAIDNGASRKSIIDYLLDKKIPFIDVGIGVQISDDFDSPKLRGSCRVTLGTESKNDHIYQKIDLNDDQENDIYNSNIQTSDLNALNASLAVIRWKQLMGFYLDQMNAHNFNFTIPLQSFTRDDCIMEE